MPSRHDMTSSGGVDFLALRREPEKSLIEQQNDAIIDQTNIICNLGAHICDLNGKIIDLEKTVAAKDAEIEKLKGDLIAATIADLGAVINCDVQRLENKINTHHEFTQFSRICRKCNMSERQIIMTGKMVCPSGS